jgi:ribose 5-phosphate isomerase A
MLRTKRPCVGPVVTDNANFILDWYWEREEGRDWAAVNVQLQTMPGVLETGLFVNMAHKVRLLLIHSDSLTRCRVIRGGFV